MQVIYRNLAENAILLYRETPYFCKFCVYFLHKYPLLELNVDKSSIYMLLYI